MKKTKLTKMGALTLGAFMDWAKRQVMSESTPWVLVKTINVTGRWELPKKPAKKRKVKR